MGKVVKTVLKVAAVAAIAYFAPPLAASIGSSIGVSGALATTALSTGIGAAAGELTGVGWQSGAFAGGLAGAGQSGLFGGKAAGAAGSAGGGTAAPAAGTAGTATTAPVAGVAGAPVDLVPTAMGGTAQYGAAAAAPAAAAPSSIGGALSGAAAKPTSVLTQGLKNVQAGVGGALGAAGGALGVNLGAAAPMLIGGALAGAPGAELAAAQTAELKRAQQVNAALTQQRLDQANQLIGEAAYYDPEYMARQAAEAAMIRGGVQTAERTRGLTGERLAAERRRMALGTSRTAGSAYQQGYSTGVGDRVKTRQAGIQAIPTEFPTTNPQGALAATEAARQSKAQEEAGLAALFGQVLGQGKTTSLGA